LLDPRMWMGLWGVTLSATSILYLLPNAGPPGEAQLDKVTHLVAFGVIGLTSFLGAGGRRPSFPMLLSLVLAVLLEWLQGFVPGRQYSLIDCGANLAGTGAGFAAGFVIRAWTARQPRHSD
ncbi:MAG TPA: VanZ family protein, partial [Alphaproteobacteria bacterium]|nr:VanZ family protein [Alphaproteobacteria bacterium]